MHGKESKVDRLATLIQQAAQAYSNSYYRDLKKQKQKYIQLILQQIISYDPEENSIWRQPVMTSQCWRQHWTSWKLQLQQHAWNDVTWNHRTWCIGLASTCVDTLHLSFSITDLRAICLYAWIDENQCSTCQHRLIGEWLITVYNLHRVTKKWPPTHGSNLVKTSKLIFKILSPLSPCPSGERHQEGSWTP